MVLQWGATHYEQGTPAVTLPLGFTSFSKTLRAQRVKVKRHDFGSKSDTASLGVQAGRPCW